MAKNIKGSGSQTPEEFPQVPPRDLYPTSDIRFVLVEIGKLTAKVDHLIADVASQGTKIDEIRHQASFIKGAMWIGGVLIAIAIAVASFVINTKWDAVIQAIRAVHK